MSPEPGADLDRRAPPGIVALIESRTRPDPPRNAASAATVIVLRDRSGEEEVLLEERATREGDPASGQISLPGGHVDARDTDLRATALRELEEEVGLSRDDLAGPVGFFGIGRMAFRHLDIAVFAAALNAGRPLSVSPQVDEVRSLFWMPRSALERSRRVTVPSQRGPLEVDANVYEGFVLWGFTRRVLLDFFQVP